MLARLEPWSCLKKLIVTVFAFLPRQFWFAFDKPEGFETLMIGGTVPVIERFWNTRVAAAVIGPGLSTDDISSLPTEISDQIPSGMGAVAVPGIPDQETCHFLEDPLSTGEDPRLGGVSLYVSSMGGDEAPFAAFHDWPYSRCFFHEKNGGSENWMVLDKLVNLSSTGRHYMVFWSPGDQVLGEPTHTAKFGVVFGDVGQSDAFHGSVADAGDCALPAQDFYENACRMEPDESIYPRRPWHAECEPFYGVPVPNLYACSESGATDEHCNTLCHNEGTCLPADAVSCPGECAETCSYAACPGTQGPLGPACPDGCSADRRRARKLLFGSIGSDCPPECLGDFHHDH